MAQRLPNRRLAHKATLNAALGFVRDHLRRRFADFKLCAHFLDLRGLLFKLSRENLHSFLLLGDGGFQGLRLSCAL